jgi:hypothetical protein
MKTLKLTGNMVTIPIDRSTGECVVDAKRQVKREVEAAFAAVQAIAETIRSLGSVPNGVLYAQVMGYLDLAAYDRVIGILKRTRLVTEENHLLTWAGPK